VNAVLSFAAALISLRLAGRLARERHWAWAGGLLSFAAAAAAMAWGAAHGWDARAFRVYYLAGALLSAPLLGVGSLHLWGRRWAGAAGLLWVGLSVGIALAMSVHGSFGTAVPRAQSHVDAVARVAAIAGSSLGSLAVLLVAIVTVRRRPLANALIVAAVGAAAAASALTQTAVAAAAAGFAAAAVLLYIGVKVA
jgi:hypothetical protein